MPYEHFSNRFILILEDDDNDAFLLDRALRKTRISNPIKRVRNGQEAIDWLTGRIGGPPSARPAFIITDLKMPLLNGLDFLKWLRSQQDLRAIPTLVLTASGAERDVAEAYGFGANSYMVKPGSQEELEKLGKLIRDYWENCELPPL